MNYPDSIDELDLLTAHAAAVDADALPPVAPQGENGQPLPPPVNYLMEATGIVGTFAALVKGYCPETAEVWTDQTRDDVAAALAPTMEHYQWTMGGMPPWVMTLFVAGPPLFQTAKIVRLKMEASKSKQDAPAVGGSVEAGPEQLVHPQVKLYAKGGG